MGKRDDRMRVVSDIIAAAGAYKNSLVGKSFLYVFDDRYIEVIYRVRDFAHLTGVDTILTGTDFYKEAIRGTLKENQIYFSSRHPYDLCSQKVQWMKVLPNVLIGPMFILENIKTNSISYNFGLTEEHFTLCLDVDARSKLTKNKVFIARSLRIENCAKRASNIYDVDYIFCKPNDKKKIFRINILQRPKAHR